MAKDFLNGINLGQTQLFAGVMEVLAADPATPVDGQLWYQSTLNKLSGRENGTVVRYLTDVDVPTSVAPANGNVPIAAAGVSTIQEGWIPSLDVLVTGNAPAGDIDVNTQKIINLADPTNAQDAASKNYVDTFVQGLAAKDSVRAATTADITLSGAQTIDTITLAVGDRVLVKDQATQPENGLYEVQAGAWTRTLDADSGPDLASAFVAVEEGATNGDTRWYTSFNSGQTVGTDNVVWSSLAIQTYTSSNQGTNGVGVFDGQVGNDFQFRNVNSLSTALTVALDAADNDIDLDIVPGQIDHDTLLNFDINEHRVINDAAGAGATTELWSADKITTELANNAGNAANVGAGGVGVFRDVTGGTINLRNINGDGATIAVALDAANNEIDISALPAGIDHDALLNFDINEHRTINDAGTAATDLLSAQFIHATFAKKFSANIPAGTTPVVPHGLATVDIFGVEIKRVATGEVVETDFTVDATNINFTFATAVTAGEYRVSGGG